MTFFFTRTIVSLESFSEMVGPLHEEANLEEEWVEVAVELGRAAQSDLGSLRVESQAFHAWLDSDGRRHGLKDPTRAADVQMAFRGELRRQRADSIGGDGG